MKVDLQVRVSLVSVLSTGGGGGGGKKKFFLQKVKSYFKY